MLRNNNLYFYNILTFFFFFLALFLSKIIDHSPNFTPLLSLIIISTFIIANKTFLILIILSSMILSDLIIGIYSGISFLYLVIILIALTVDKVFKNINLKNIFLISIYASGIFYLFTNPLHLVLSNNSILSFEAFIRVYIDGLPFFKNTIISTLFFSYLLFILIKFAKKIQIKKKVLHKFI